jgi:hypothetical protein
MELNHGRYADAALTVARGLMRSFGIRGGRLNWRPLSLPPVMLRQRLGVPVRPLDVGLGEPGPDARPTYPELVQNHDAFL